MKHSDFSNQYLFEIELHTVQVYPGAMVTSEQLAEKMKVEILADMQAGVVPESVKNFSDLHNYVDANCYGGGEALLDELNADATTDEEHTKALNILCDLMNPAMEIVNKWLANGGPRLKLSQKGTPKKSANTDGTVIPCVSDKVANAANMVAIDRLVGTTKYRNIVAWGKWLGFTPHAVLRDLEQAEKDDAPVDVIQKIDGRWLQIGDIQNESNRLRVIELAENHSLDELSS